MSNLGILIFQAVTGLHPFSHCVQADTLAIKAHKRCRFYTYLQTGNFQAYWDEIDHCSKLSPQFKRFMEKILDPNCLHTDLQELSSMEWLQPIGSSDYIQGMQDLIDSVEHNSNHFIGYQMEIEERVQNILSQSMF